MKVTYRNTDTKTIELELDDQIATALTESYRKEDNLARKHRYHNYSFEAATYQGLEVADDETPESILLEAEEETESNAHVAQALSLLTDVQRKRFLLLMEGMSVSEIARSEGTNQKTVYASIELARKKLRKLYGDIA